MVETGFIRNVRGAPARFSFFFITATLVLAAVLNLGTPLVVALFAYLAVSKLHFGRRTGKWFTVILFVVLISGVMYGLGHFLNHTVRALPEIAEKAIPSVIEFASRYNIELPFSDYDTFKEAAIEAVKTQAQYLRGAARFASGAGKQLTFVLVGIVVAIGIFLNPRLQPPEERRRQDLYSVCGDQVATRFELLYRSFCMVMGAQIVISAINTVFTAIFVLAVHLPYALVIVGLTFLCGLIPVVGNLISNTVIVGVGFTISPGMALGALVFLIGIHKLEYFLNSKIIGNRIRFPLWMTLLGLVLGERLMGVPGMILAPVVLNYIRMEASQIKVEEPTAAPPTAEVEPAEKLARR